MNHGSINALRRRLFTATGMISSVNASMSRCPSRGALQRRVGAGPLGVTTRFMKRHYTIVAAGSNSCGVPAAGILRRWERDLRLRGCTRELVISARNLRPQRRSRISRARRGRRPALHVAKPAAARYRNFFRLAISRWADVEDLRGVVRSLLVARPASRPSASPHGAATRRVTGHHGDVCLWARDCAGRLAGLR